VLRDRARRNHHWCVDNLDPLRRVRTALSQNRQIGIVLKDLVRYHIVESIDFISYARDMSVRWKRLPCFLVPGEKGNGGLPEEFLAHDPEPTRLRAWAKTRFLKEKKHRADKDRDSETRIQAGPETDQPPEGSLACGPAPTRSRARARDRFFDEESYPSDEDGDSNMRIQTDSPTGPRIKTGGDGRKSDETANRLAALYKRYAENTSGDIRRLARSAILHMMWEDFAGVLRSIAKGMDVIELSIHDDLVLQDSMPLWREQLGKWPNILFHQSRALERVFGSTIIMPGDLDDPTLV